VSQVFEVFVPAVVGVAWLNHYFALDLHESLYNVCVLLAQYGESFFVLEETGHTKLYSKQLFTEKAHQESF
jgi:hypothetical protein